MTVACSDDDDSGNVVPVYGAPFVPEPDASAGGSGAGGAGATDVDAGDADAGPDAG
jgi:hypothetical protein